MSSNDGRGGSEITNYKYQRIVANRLVDRIAIFITLPDAQA